MTKSIAQKCIIAISSRALFDLSESHQIYESEGIEAYQAHQRDNEQTVLPKGPAFALVKKFLSLNQDRCDEDALVEVLLLSRNSADTGLRIFNSIHHYDLKMTRAAFTGGRTPYGYANAFGADLFLSLDPEDVRQALAAGCAAGAIWPGHCEDKTPDTLNIAFDGDAVLFSDESEQIYQSQGLNAFNAHEKESAHLPMPAGPFKGFLSALHRLQQLPDLPIPIRTALVTARSAPAHERVIKTLRAWDIRIDESLFLGGLPKVDFLTAFNADVFFDDQATHCEKSHQKVTSAQVLYGVGSADSDV